MGQSDTVLTVMYIYIIDISMLSDLHSTLSVNMHCNFISSHSFSNRSCVLSSLKLEAFINRHVLLQQSRSDTKELQNQEL